MRAIFMIPVLAAMLFCGCGRSDSAISKQGEGNQPKPKASVDAALGAGASIQLGKATTVVQPDGTKYDFTVQEFAPYQSEDKTLVGLGAIVVAIVPVTGHPSLDIKKTTAVAKVRDGSTASLFGLRAFIIDAKEQSMRIGTLSTNKVGGMSYIRDTASSVGNYFVNDPWKNPTFTFEANNDLVLSFDLNGTNAMTLGLILDAQFTNVQTLTFFGKILTTKHLP
jgi:hypothetical protein